MTINNAVTITLDSRVVVPPSVLMQEVGGESVLLNLDSERYFGLDEVGTRMWQVFAEGGSIRAACDQLLAEYEVAPEVLEGDALALLGELAAQGLILVLPANAEG